MDQFDPVFMHSLLSLYWHVSYTQQQCHTSLILLAVSPSMVEISTYPLPPLSPAAMPFATSSAAAGSASIASTTSDCSANDWGVSATCMIGLLFILPPGKPLFHSKPLLLNILLLNQETPLLLSQHYISLTTSLLDKAIYLRGKRLRYVIWSANITGVQMRRIISQFCKYVDLGTKLLQRLALCHRAIPDRYVIPTADKILSLSRPRLDLSIYQKEKGFSGSCLHQIEHLCMYVVYAYTVSKRGRELPLQSP